MRRWFFVVVLGPVVVFAVLHCTGGPEHTSVLAGLPGDLMLGIGYTLSWLVAIVLSPIVALSGFFYRLSGRSNHG